MIELLGIIPSWFIAVVFAATLVVNRAGASKIFFDVVGTFQANRLVMEGGAAFATFQSLAMDAFSGIEEVAMLVNEQIQEIVDSTVPLSREIAAARIEFDKFISDAEQARLGDEIKDIGVQFGFTGDQALRAGAKMAQLSGMLGEEAVPAATEMSLAFGMIGEMEAEQAMQRLINLHQQTGFMMRGTTQAQFDAMSADEQRNQIRVASIATLNELNAVEDHSAANMERITFVMNQFAAQAHLTGESIAHMAAMSAVLIEAGEEQGKAGRALRMIYARLGADTNGAASELEALGVAVKKADGTLRPLNEILIDLDNNTVNLSKAERQRIAQTVAGNNHYVRMLKLMEGTERMQSLVGEATGNTAPIVDILNDRFKDMSVQLTQAETKLNNVRGEIGDAFMPAMVDATNAQVAFNEAYLQFVNMDFLFIGDILQGIVGFQQIAQGTIAPLMTMNMNAKQLSVGLMTSVVVMRSLNGATTAGFNKEQQLNMLRQEGKNLLRDSENSKIKGNDLLKIGIALEQQEKRILLEKQTFERYSGKQGKTRLTIDKMRLVHLKQELTEKKKITHEDDINLKRQKHKAGNHANLKILTKQERMEHEQITMDLKEQIELLESMIRIKIAGNHLSDEQFRTGVAITNNLRQQNQEIQKYNFQHLMKLSSAFMQAQIGAMLATMAIGPFASALGFGEDSARKARVQMIMMTITMGLMIGEMGIFTSATVNDTNAKVQYAAAY
jgi:TP901 family phage tail tape measure protein